jgi:AcrR family transcriptional regulator
MEAMSELDRRSRPKRRGRPPGIAKKAILAAAWKLIGDEGVAHLTTKEVARRAGVSEASIFYHFGDKIGLLGQVMISELEPLRELDVDLIYRQEHEPVDEMLLDLARGLEKYLGRVLLVVETVQAEGALRREFARRNAKQGLGPHRGVQLVARHLVAAQHADQAMPGVDAEAVGFLLVGACLLNVWYRRVMGTKYRVHMPELPRVVETLAQLLTR